MSDQDSEIPDEYNDPTSILNESVMSALDAMTIQLNEVYESLKRAGFNQPEAITMVTGLLSNMIQYSPIGPMLDDDEDDTRNNQDYNDYNDYNNDEDDDDWNGPQDRY